MPMSINVKLITGVIKDATVIYENDNASLLFTMPIIEYKLKPKAIIKVADIIIKNRADNIIFFIIIYCLSNIYLSLECF